MQELEKILEEIRRVGSIRFANFIEPVISVGEVEKIIRKHMNDEWIPVEERLPEVGEYVLGTTKSGEVLIFRYGWNSPHSKKMFFHLCGAAATITAWRPLPDPYQPERRADNETD